MGKFIDLTGQLFGEWTVLKRGVHTNKKTYWVCKCNCIRGAIKEVRGDLLKNGSSKSCGECLWNKYETKNGYIQCFTKEQESFLIDAEDFNKIKEVDWKIFNGYVYGNIEGENTLLHRYIMSFYCDLGNYIIDHEDHNKTNNRKYNLRVCSHSQNSMNNKEVRSCTGFKGVYLDRRNGNYRVTLKLRSVKINIGCFTSLEEAIEARILAEIKYFKEFRYKDNDEYLERIINKKITSINDEIISKKNKKIDRPVLQYSLQNEFIKEYSNAVQAGKMVDGYSQHIYDCCNYRRKTHKGFIWKFKNELERRQVDNNDTT